MKLSHIILLITLSVLSGCNHANINDASKRNENWVWFVDKATGVGKWVPVAKETTVKDGDFTTFYSFGKVYSKGRLKDYKPVDTTFYYSSEGALILYELILPDTSIIYYSTNGSYTSYYNTGELRERGIVENHNRGNQWTWYHKNGLVSIKKILIDGTGWKMHYYESGKLKDSCHYTNNIQDGLGLGLFENGAIEEKSNWKDGQLNGEGFCWYSNKQLKFVTNYQNGKKDGLFTTYFENGQVKGINKFKGGLRDGEQVGYYSNGKLRGRSFYIDGKQENESLAYYDNGTLLGINHFQGGQLYGEQTIYYSNGQLGAKGIFSNGKKEGVWQYRDSLGRKVEKFPQDLSDKIGYLYSLENK